MAQQLTGTQLLATATEILSTGGYREALPPTPSSQSGGASRLFEDAYGIVAIHVYESWRQLTEQWHVAQGELVDLISEHLTRPEPKAWEGYLVLLTPGLLPPTERTRINELRYDTNRVRKLVASGDDLATLDGVRLTLLPLLPLEIEQPVAGQSGLLERLPDLLGESDVPADLTRVIVSAFQANDSIVDRLHSARLAL
jgi:hypothetical protein